MRIRSIKPIYWRDRELARLGDEVRLFYIGLWMQADDGGVFRWDVDEIAADLYPYMPERARLKKVERCAAALLAMPGEARLVVSACKHAILTRFLDHQKSGMPGESKRVLTFVKQHEKCQAALLREPPREPANPREGLRTEDVGRDGTEDRDMRAGARNGSKDPERTGKLPTPEERRLQLEAELLQPDLPDWRRQAITDQLAVMARAN